MRITRPSQKILRAAKVVQRQYALSRPLPGVPALPTANMQRAVSLHGRLQLANRCQLSEATEVCRAELQSQLRDLVHDIQLCQESLRQTPLPLPPLSLLYEELASLKGEFERVAFDLRDRRISVQTERIVLEQIDLGPFEIQIAFNGPGGSCSYEVIAIDPHPSRHNIPHPHVHDTTLCEGDGKRSIARALDEGRLGEFFVLVRQILRTYNEQSAYESLAHWHGVDCSECGTVTSNDDSSTCDSCSCTVCEDCARSCQRCECGLCYECNQSCEGCDENYCRSCLEPCDDCCERFCEECLTDGRCASCMESDEGDTDAEDDTLETITIEPGDKPTTRATTDAAVQPDRVGEAALLA